MRTQFEAEERALLRRELVQREQSRARVQMKSRAEGLRERQQLRADFEAEESEAARQEHVELRQWEVERSRELRRGQEEREEQELAEKFEQQRQWRKRQRQGPGPEPGSSKLLASGILKRLVSPDGTINTAGLGPEELKELWSFFGSDSGNGQDRSHFLWARRDAKRKASGQPGRYPSPGPAQCGRKELGNTQEPGQTPPRMERSLRQSDDAQHKGRKGQQHKRGLDELARGQGELAARRYAQHADLQRRAIPTPSPARRR